ncbi:MAG TPA: permease-like cell division protein FtsX, partial [Actinomycetota bacterium]|nr:permease-like cell division protein FtsX [Actinomycetota bacterium]
MARRLGYFFRETTGGLRRNGLIAFAAISTVFVSLFLLGAALLVGREVDLIAESTGSKVEVSVFLKDSISQSQIDRLERLISDMPEVASVEFESKEAAYERFKRIFANQEALVQNVTADAMPQSFRIKLNDPEKFEVISARLANEPGIDQIIDQREILKRLFAVTRVLRVGAFAAGIIMLLSAAALIGNTVRMAVFARRKEIGIMKLVGATNWFIRVPFLIEGMVEGLLGAGAAILGLLVIKVAFIDPLRNNIGFLPLIGTSDVLFAVPWLIAAGVLVAVLASLFAMR